MVAFLNEDERAAWMLAEALMAKGRDMMRQAEDALEEFSQGKELNRQRCAQRGIGATDAEIRWNETAPAKKAIAVSNFNASQALLYYGAAAAHYSRAAYLRGRGRPVASAINRAMPV
jgi:hypothetical protein